ncbi:MAG: hypothetical protein U0271_42630 [Polyangiaceae bacterium]
MARASGELGGILVDLGREPRSCSARVVAQALLSEAVHGAPKTIEVVVRAKEDEPYSGCLCFPDLQLHIRDLPPGRYRLTGQVEAVVEVR